MSFPLYDNLNSQIKSPETLTVKEKISMIQNIKSFDDDGYELIYTLILFHQRTINTYVKLSNIPYNGKIQKQGMKFDIDNFPVKLQRILFEFTLKHCSKMQADKNRPNDYL